MTHALCKFIRVQIKVGLVKDGSLFNDMHFVASDALKLNNVINGRLIN